MRNNLTYSIHPKIESRAKDLLQFLIHNQNAYQRLLHLQQKAYMAMAKKKGTSKIAPSILKNNLDCAFNLQALVLPIKATHTSLLWAMTNTTYRPISYKSLFNQSFYFWFFLSFITINNFLQLLAYCPQFFRFE
jgi:hypothetical protein